MANLLDVFSIGFQSDGLKQFEQELKSTENKLKTAEKKVKDLENSLEELRKEGKEDTAEFKDLSAQLVVAKDDVNKFSESLKKMQGKGEYQLLQLKKNFGQLAKSIAKLAAVTVAVRKSMQFYEQAEQLDFLSQKANVAVETLQKFGNMAARYGGNVETSASTFESLRSEDAKKTFMEKGVKLSYAADLKTVDVEQTLANVAAKMETLKSDAEKIDLANSLGIDEATTRILIQGVDKYREQLKRADKYKLYTKEDIARMKDYQQVQQDIRLNIQNIESALARLLLPAILAVGKVIRGITDWLREHEGAVKIIATLVAVSAAIGGVSLAVKLLNGAIGLLTANPVVLTIAAWTLAITALIALINDFVVFLQGGDSIIGRILQHFNIDVEKTRQTVISVFKSITEWVKNTIQWFVNLGGKIAEVAKLIAAVLGSLPQIFGTIGKIINPFNTAKIAVERGRSQLNQANNNPLNAVTNNSVSNYYQTEAINKSNTVNTNSIIYNNSNSKGGVKVGTINVQTQATNGGQLAKELSAIMDTDNGFAVQ